MREYTNIQERTVWLDTASIDAIEVLEVPNTNPDNQTIEPGIAAVLVDGVLYQVFFSGDVLAAFNKTDG
jgi:hypothetical protein